MMGYAVASLVAVGAVVGLAMGVAVGAVTGSVDGAVGSGVGTMITVSVFVAADVAVETGWVGVGGMVGGIGVAVAGVHLRGWPPETSQPGSVVRVGKGGLVAMRVSVTGTVCGLGAAWVLVL